MQSKLWILCGLAAFGLAACETDAYGNSRLTPDAQRAGIGAAVGAGAAAVTDNDVGTGAVLGAGAGALCDDVAPALCRR
ncbi:hypothetical protein EKE94_01510 [Mesobaculum littorinae]|uniref:YMGG-like Gly-zipper domain-containing protein n=1 Tax=Mesobaculum littorinae TaxID=2486419 RepID=A0A438AKZ1_9RHOB|nr:hypothetical protein [Mesobaculum littorinae]RVV99398.1 hypothetical protein EKE94_01510 [Mesobaculum littorinae]